MVIVCSRRPKKRIDGKARLKKLKTRDEHEDKLLNETMFDRTRKDFPNHQWQITLAGYA